jgi:hypothetical protein
MESSKRYLLIAEIAFWREMLQLNNKSLSNAEVQVMRFHLHEAEEKLHVGHQYPELRAAA